MIITGITNPAIDPLKEIEFFGKNGFQAVELSIEEPFTSPDRLSETSKEIDDLINKYKMDRLAHSNPHINVSAPEPEIQQESNQMLRLI